MEIPQSKAYEIVGQQQIEIVVLREHIKMLQSHQCEPCERQHVDDALAGEEAGNAKED